MGYFLAAYAIAWALIFAHVWSLGRRQARLEREVELLRELLAREPRA